MRALPVNIEHHPGEPAFSFASRLAAAMGVPSLRDFCRHMTLPYDALLSGDAKPIEQLAVLGRADPVDLRRHSPIRRDGLLAINGQKISKKDIWLRRLWSCPACLADDIEKGGGPVASRPLPAIVLAYPRTCAVHRVPLVDLGKGQASTVSHDIAAIANLHCPQLTDHGTSADPLPDSGFANYVHSRLFGCNGPPFLDALPFHVAVRFTEMVDASKVFGKSFDRRHLSSEDWWRAGQMGFAVTSEGKEGLRPFLASQLESFWETEHVAGGQTMLGTIYSWLQSRIDAPDFATVCALVREHAVDTLPLGPGNDFLGPIQTRRWHSIHSAAKEYAIHPKRLRKQLATAGYIKSGHEEFTDDRTLFEAGPAAPLLAELACSMSADEASDYGGIPRNAWKLLVGAGIIRPISGRGSGGSYTVFARSAIDDFLGRLTRTAVSVKAAQIWPLPKLELTSIQAAAKRAKCSIVEIVLLLLDGELNTVGIKEGLREFRAIMVKPDEIHQKLARPGLKGVKLREVERSLGTTTLTVRALVDGGYLEAVRELNPVSRCPQTVVVPEALQTFAETYVSLSQLARERRMQIAALKRELDEAEIAPAFDLGEKVARFYERAKLSWETDS